MSDRSRKFPHIYLSDKGKSEKYTRPPQCVGISSPPVRNRAEHAQALLLAVATAIHTARKQIETRDPEIATGVPGFYLEFQVQADRARVFEKLENRTKKIELVAVKQISEEEGMVTATVFVPESAIEYFLNKVKEYRDEDTVRGKPKNEALISRLETVQIGTVNSLFTDDPNLFPRNGQDVWWEVWLRKDRRSAFDRVTQMLSIRVKPHTISFYEREIVLVMSNIAGIAQIIKNSDTVAELGCVLNKVEKYCDEDIEKNNYKNEAPISKLEIVQIGIVRSLFKDDLNLFPENGQEVWWEVWLRKDRRSAFDRVTQMLSIRVKPHTIYFYEREIVLVMSNIAGIAQIIKNSDAVAELRISKDIPSIFLEMGPREQSEWTKDLAERLIEPGEQAVAISVLDSGTTRIHPLLNLGLSSNDMHTVEPSWGTDDKHGHGTAMAGI